MSAALLATVLALATVMAAAGAIYLAHRRQQALVRELRAVFWNGYP